MLHFLVMTLVCGAPPPAPPTVKPIPDELTQMAAKMKQVQTLSVAMHQEKTLLAFGDTLQADGRLVFARPRRLWMDLTGPGGTTLAINDAQMAVHYKTLDKTEHHDLRRDPRAKAVAEHLFLLLDADPVALAAVYAVSLLKSQPLTVRLVPLAPALHDVISSVEAQIDANGFVSRLELLEANGDKTVWRFSAPVINQPVADSLFALGNP